MTGATDNGPSVAPRHLREKHRLWTWRWRSSSGYTMLPFGASCWGYATAELQWQPRDKWIGVYREAANHSGSPRFYWSGYVCLLPCLPLKVSLYVHSAKTRRARREHGYGWIGRRSA